MRPDDSPSGPHAQASRGPSISRALATALLGLATLAVACVAPGLGDGAPARPLLERTGEDGPVLRVMSWNVRLDSIHPPDGLRHEAYQRIVRAVQPDVVCMQEVWDTPDREARLTALMDACLPLGDGRTWQAVGGADNVILSRHPLRCGDRELVIPYPLPELGRPDFHYGQAMARVDVLGMGGVDDVQGVYIVALHNKSGAGARPMQLRQRQSDAVVRWLRELRRSERAGCLPDGTPLLVLGDLNVLEAAPGDPLRHFATLVSGDIDDEAVFGPDHPLDWDGTALTDVRPSHNARGEVFSTWRDDSTPYPPGALDRILYSDSVIGLVHAFVLDTTSMSVEVLGDAGLRASDVLWKGRAGCYDHLPLVADFRLRPASAGE